MSFIARKVGRKIAGNKLAAYEPEDPHYEEYVDKKGRKRHRKRAMPAGLSKRDERILRSVRRRAHYLDKGFSICGFRFGWTAILGLIPGAGDIAQFLLGYSLVLRKCREAELPLSLQQRMLFNQLCGLGIGLVPFVGDIAMAVFKANSRNAALLEEFLIRRASSTTPNTIEGEEAAAEEAIANSRIERRTGEMSQVEPMATVPGSAPTAATGPGAGNVAAAHAAQDKTAAKKRGWYGWGSGGGAQQPAPGAATATTATSRTNATAPTSSTAVVR
ncbi:hypothetical protein C6P46_004715 [Rhodotorula mucilaginosa]|uniref:Uncharacterized protein n=1 Tax=Rhodotorula mucilaginosa TaxID=5537 RepID=A0A9P7B591_RHOMI|nr:hypothetical protein C6P46_004715 [Rhodotorula mucilaginosa]